MIPKKDEGSLGQLTFIQKILVQDWLQKDLHLSRTRIKEFDFSKSFLSREINERETFSFDLNLLNHDIINPVYTGSEISKLSEDENFLVISKPNNVHLYPFNYSEDTTVLNYLRMLGYGRDVLNVASDKHEKGALYRLDFETSGVLVFAKNAEVHRNFFEERMKSVSRKIYLAIVRDKEIATGTHVHYFEGLAKGGPKVKCSKESGHDRTKGTIEIISVESNKNENVKLVAIELGEGHRHQIRAQLATLGAPILGDTLYGGEEAERLFLHAWTYVFSLKGNTFSFNDDSAPLFGNFFDFNCCLQVLRNQFRIAK